MIAQPILHRRTVRGSEVDMSWYSDKEPFDEFELPMCIADSAKELGEKYGVTADTVITLARAHWSGRTTGRRFVKVRNDDWKHV